jgi:hypothetical protein
MGASLMNVLYIDVWRHLLVADGPTALYLTITPASYVAAITAVTIGGGVLGLVGAGVWCLDHRFTRSIVIAVLLATFVPLVESARRLLHLTLPALLRSVAWVPTPMGLALLGLLVLALGTLVWRHGAAIARVYAAALLLAAPFVLVTVGRAVWLRATLDFDAFADIPTASINGRVAPNRLVVIVFDELDQELAFTRRVPSLQMPVFDRLLGHAVALDSAFSPAARTKESLPSYWTGVTLTGVEAAGARAFTARRLSGSLVRGDSMLSMFERAARHGMQVGVVGFYLPYCRLPFAARLATCQWLPAVGGGSIDRRREGVASAAWGQLRSLDPLNGRRTHVERVKSLTAAAAIAASDSTLDLVFIHLPVPHMPAIYDRRTQRFVVAIGRYDYTDNLALADRVLGEIHGAMRRAGQWERTAVVVTSDHPFRGKAPVGSVVDKRVPFIYKAPYGRNAQRDVRPRSALEALNEIVGAFLASRA